MAQQNAPTDALKRAAELFVGWGGIEIKITISDYIAALALIVSLLSFGISLYSGLRDRVHLRAISKLYNLSGEFGPAYIKVKVVNRGRRPAIQQFTQADSQWGQA